MNNKPVAYGMLTFCKNCGEQNPYAVKELTEILSTIKCLADDVSPHKEYENTYSDGWIDACNTVYDEVFAILRKAQEK